MHPLREFYTNDPTPDIMLSGWLIFLAMIFDALDGHVARLVKLTSDFGAQLDSLCDLVTFGVAPAFLVVKMCPDFTYLHREAMWIIAAAFAACAAMRLARFTVETDDDDDHLNFIGLPAPAAAGTIAGFAILFYTLRVQGGQLAVAENADWYLRRVLPVFTLILSALMVSRIPYPHVMNQLLSGQRSLGHIVALLFSPWSSLQCKVTACRSSVRCSCSVRRCVMPGSAGEIVSNIKKPNRYSNKVQNAKCRMQKVWQVAGVIF